MSGTGVRILSPGPQTTVQDLGRPGFQQIGMGSAGAMDPLSARIANLLVGNVSGAALLEAVLAGPTMVFEAPALCAVTGGAAAVTLNGAPVGMWRAFRANPGDRLALGPVTAGARVYLAFSGGVAVPPVMGSRATSLPAATGGYEGRALKAGDSLPLGRAEGRTVAPLRELPAAHRPAHLQNAENQAETILRVVPGPQQAAFTRRGIKAFYGGRYTLTGQSDRMGYRFDGPAIEAKNGTDILSDGTVTGAIQVAGDGLPMLLMADRQTTGGYAKIGVVATADLPCAAQLRPGEAVRFQAVGVAEAQGLLRRQAEWLAALEEKLVPAEQPPAPGGVWQFTATGAGGRVFTGIARRMDNP